MDIQTVGKTLEARGQILRGDLNGINGRSVAVQSIDRGHVHAGLGVVEGDGQVSAVPFLADDGRRFVVDGADALILRFHHAVKVAGGDFEGSVFGHGGGVGLGPGFRHFHGFISQKDPELRDRQRPGHLHLKGDGAVIHAVSDGQLEVRLCRREPENDEVDDDERNNIEENAFRPLFFPFPLPDGMAAGRCGIL